MDSTITLLSKSKISILQPSSVLVQLGLCQTWSETILLVFPQGGSYNMFAVWQITFVTIILGLNLKFLKEKAEKVKNNYLTAM